MTLDGEFDFVSSQKSSGALVAKDWYLAMQKWLPLWALAAHCSCNHRFRETGRKCPTAWRRLSGIHFGDSAFESPPGTKIVNFVTALERITTTTESFSTHKFCSRVGCSIEEERTWGARWMLLSVPYGEKHLRFFPTSAGFRKKVSLAHDLTVTSCSRTRSCIFDARKRTRLTSDLHEATLEMGCCAQDFFN